MDDSGTRLLLILKPPIPGQVKTRLAEKIGTDGACAAYRRMVEALIAELSGWKTEIHYAVVGDEPDDAMRAWLGQGHDYFPQVEGDLGMRMEAAVAGALRRGAARAILLGGDCPYIGRELLEQAVAGLRRSDIVFGPAVDGGYYLLGQSELHLPLFRGMEWSNDRVLKESIRRARADGITFELLPELEDVDAAASWERAREYLDRVAG